MKLKIFLYYNYRRLFSEKILKFEGNDYEKTKEL